MSLSVQLMTGEPALLKLTKELIAKISGKVPQLHVEKSPEIIEKEMWEIVKFEKMRQFAFTEKYGLKMDNSTTDKLFT